MNDILVEVAEAVPVEVNLPAKDNAIEMEVYYQDEVSLDTDLALFYIKSGEKEIENYVEGVAKPEIDNYIEAYAKPIVSEVVDSIATPIIDEYFEETVKPSITEFANKEMAGYAAEATAQAAIATESAALAANTAQSVDVKVAEFSEQTEASKQEFIAFAGEKTEEFEQTAQQATADSQANVEKSRIWAEGEQAEVETLGGELSSRGFADFAYAIANAPEDVPLDNSNLIALDIIKGEKGDKGDKGDRGTDGKDGVDGKSVFDGYATNCITEIPQDIKLELNDGTLNTKSGSRLWVPYGTEDLTAQHPVGSVFLNNNFKVAETKFSDGKFFVCVEVVADIPHSQYGSGSNDYMLTIDIEGNTDAPLSASASSSGTTNSSATEYIHYNTTTNKISYLNLDGKNSATCSFPIVICSRVSGVVSGVVQTFNGFGYIGSTVFALPNVKGLIPNGRNADGSLKNIEFTVDKVLVNQASYNAEGASLGLSSSLVNYVTINDVVYDEKDNKNIVLSNGRQWRSCFAGSVSVSDMKFTSVQPKTTFHAVDRNDSSWIAQQAMPSSKCIDLTLGASGSNYTAPANGYFFISKSGSSGQYVTLTTKTMAIVSVSNGGQAIVYLPVKKGAEVRVNYNLNGATNVFRFIYAEGEN